MSNDNTQNISHFKSLVSDKFGPYATGRDREAFKAVETALVPLAQANDVAGMVTFIKANTWFKAHDSETILLYLVQNNLRSVYAEPTAYKGNFKEKNYTLSDEVNVAFENYMKLLNNEHVPLSVKLAGADLMMDRAYMWVRDTQPEAKDYKKLVEIKDTIYAYQANLLAAGTDFNHINTRLPMDVTGVEQAQIYTQAIDWTVPIVDGSLKEKLFNQVINLAKEHDTRKFNDNPSDLVKMALIFDNLQTQVKQQAKPEYLSADATKIFEHTAYKLVTKDNHISVNQKLEHINELLVGLSGVNAAKFLGRLTNWGHMRDNLLQATPDQLKELITSVRVAKQNIQPTLANETKAEADYIKTNTLQFDTLLSSVVMERTEDLPELLPYLAVQKPALALNDQTIINAKKLRDNLQPQHQDQLDVVIARGAVNHVGIDKKSQNVTKEFAHYYASIESKAARDNIKAELVAMGTQSPHKAEFVQTLIEAGRDKFKQQSKIPAFMHNIVDALGGDKYKVSVKVPALV